MQKHKILIAGIGGASLGTEIAKCLALANRYQIFGCDISPLAYGHFMNLFQQTFLANDENYIESILDICKKHKIFYIIPGGELPMTLLVERQDILKEEKITIVSNSPDVIKTFSMKKETFVKLKQFGFTIPDTIEYNTEKDLDQISFPCIIKPSVGTGGSDSVFLVADKKECSVLVELLKRNKRSIILQEYISLDEGEFTIGVLSLPDKTIVGSIAMKRIFNTKLSIAHKSKLGLISSGYSQGLIDDFPQYRKIAEKIALSIGSRGPLNIQGRVKEGKFIPFEINPRFSASTYLRALAGVNEIDVYLQYLIHNKYDDSCYHNIKNGHYLRSFTQEYVPSKVK